MTHASVFSGIGGPEVAATMLGWDNLFHCEINPFGRKVLDYWYPNSKSYEDITTTDFREWRGRVDVLTGGFPCQPFSYAGRRRGAEDDRYLWPSMYRAIDEIQPTWVVAENVAGILTMVEQGEVSKVAGTASLFDALDDLRGRYELRETFTLQRICTDLESHGYAVQPVLVPACAVGAPHRRDRVFIVARRLPTMDEGERGRAATDSESVGDNRTRREESRTDERPHGQTNREPIIGSGVRETRQPSADTANYGLQHDTITRSEAESNRETSRRGAELHVSTEADGSGRTTPDTTCECGQRLRPRQSEVGRAQQEQSGGGSGESGSGRLAPHPDSHRGCEVDEHMESELADGAKPVSNGGQRNVADTERPIADPRSDGRPQEDIRRESRGRTSDGKDDEQPQSVFNRAGHGAGEWGDYCGERWQNFPSVSPVHRGNDGLPFDVDRLTLSFGKWRTEALKAYGNAIVPQVMYEIFRAIEIVEQR